MLQFWSGKVHTQSVDRCGVWMSPHWVLTWQKGLGALWGLFKGTNPIPEGSTFVSWSPAKDPAPNTVTSRIRFRCEFGETHTFCPLAPTVGIVYERKLSILSNKTRRGFSECQSFGASSGSYDLIEQRHFYIFLEAGYLLASSRYCLHVEWLLTRVGCSVVLVREKRRTFKWQSIRSSALCLLQSGFFFFFQ